MQVLNTLPDATSGNSAYDFVVIGAGGAGLAAALFAMRNELRRNAPALIAALAGHSFASQRLGVPALSAHNGNVRRLRPVRAVYDAVAWKLAA